MTTNYVHFLYFEPITVSPTVSGISAGSLHVTNIRAPGGQGIFNDRARFRSGDEVFINHIVRHIDDDMETFGNPEVMWLKNGYPVGVTPSNVFGEVSQPCSYLRSEIPSD